MKIANNQQPIWQSIQSIQELYKMIHEPSSNQSQTNQNQSSQNAISPDDLLSWERTRLAMERTKLANYRTLLAFIRTSMTFFAGAAALIEFFNNNRALEITSYVAVTTGVFLLIIGIISYMKSKKSMKSMEYIK
ncbi:DUF202 domain-containing protein [Bacillus salitolerans]|uniref:DUF202 domain-containing protein n=1 Tax=Bacillus salitolerans TaxID=1437434 RepID=A0ABW4LUI6_9BACI